MAYRELFPQAVLIRVRDHETAQQEEEVDGQIGVPEKGFAAEPVAAME